jgi:acetyltransferase-like isoleucine patch superfamily enzyme
MLRWCGAKVGKGVEIFSTAKIYGQMELSIGDFCFIGHDALIFGSANSKIIIEDYAKVGSKSILVTGSHEYTPDGNCIAGKGVHADVRVCKGASVGTRAIILPGKTVNTMAHVAAGSVVTHDVPEYCRVAGVPARVIKNWKNESANQFC